MCIYYYMFRCYINTGKFEFFEPVENRTIRTNVIYKYPVSIRGKKANIEIGDFDKNTIQKILCEFIKKYNVETAEYLSLYKLKDGRFRLMCVEKMEQVKLCWKVIDNEI